MSNLEAEISKCIKCRITRIWPLVSRIWPLVSIGTNAKGRSPNSFAYSHDESRPHVRRLIGAFHLRCQPAPSERAAPNTYRWSMPPAPGASNSQAQWPAPPEIFPFPRRAPSKRQAALRVRLRHGAPVMRRAQAKVSTCRCVGRRTVVAGKGFFPFNAQNAFLPRYGNKGP